MDQNSKKAIIDKKIHEEKAFKIVSQLALETVDEKVLISIVKYIDPNHYEEIVEERFLTKVCGYPICSNELKYIPTQKYHISKANKVHDIADRKRYCSGQCYKASKFLEAQISPTPIWLRKQQADQTENIKLWSSSTNITDDFDLKFNKNLASAVSTKPQAHNEIGSEVISKSQLYTNEIEQELNKIESEWKAKFKLDNDENKTKHTKPDPHNIFKRPTVSEKNRENIEAYSDRVNNNNDNNNNQTVTNLDVNKKFLESTQIHKKPKEFYHLAQIFKIAKADETPTDEKTLSISSETALNQLIFIEYLIERIRLLISIRTREYLFDKRSNEKSKIHLEREREENLKKYEDYITKKNVFFSDLMSENRATRSQPTTGRVQYANQDEDDNGEAEMQAKIDFLNRSLEAEKHLEEEKTESHEDSSEAKKPLPDFKKIREEAAMQQLKIKEFFMPSSSGKKVQFKEEVVVEEVTNADDGDKYKQSLILNVKETNEEIIRVLPTVDSISQLDIRRKIFYDKLIKYMEQLLRFSDFSYAIWPNQLKDHIKNLVHSFNLTNENVIFQTNEWPIIALFMLKLLSLKTESSQQQHEQQVRAGVESLAKTLEKLLTSDKLIATILDSFQLDNLKLSLICAYLINS